MGVFGYWSTFAGVASDGKPVCGMSSSWANGDRYVGSFMIKYFGAPEFVVQIVRDGWRVPAGQPVALILQVDRTPAIRVEARGKDQLLEFTIGQNDVWTATGKSAVEELVNLMANGRQIVVSFPDGSEPPWVGRLDGARAALQSFTACGTTIDAANRSPGTTQPFGGGTTQPFGRRTPPDPAPTIVTQPAHRL